MFGSFFNMLYPSEKFITSVLNILKYDPSTYDIPQLNEQMNKNEQCELLNGSIDVKQLNESLKLSNFLLGNINIQKTILVFKRSYFTEKTVLSFEGIDVDIFQKIQIPEKENSNNNGEREKKDKPKEGSFLDSIINTVIHNVEVHFKNIKIRFFDKENKNVEYTFLIKGIDYEQNPNEEPIKSDKKMNYLFLHNKSVLIEGILLKEKFDESDNYFFGNNEEESKNNFSWKNNNNLFYIKNKIKIDMYFDKDNNFLTFGNNSDFYIENIFSVQQLNSIIEYFIPKEENKIDENIEIKEIEEINNEINNQEQKQELEQEKPNNNEKEKEKKGLELMGFKIKKINLDFKLSLLYFILIENNKPEEEVKDKLWLSHEDKLKNNILEHFNYFQKRYYIFYINDLMFNTKNDKIDLNNLVFKLVDSSKKDEYSYIDINKFNLDLEAKELEYDNLYFEISYNILLLLKKYIKPSKKNIKKNKVINENVEIKKEEEKKENNSPNEKKDIPEEKNNQENIINTNSNQLKKEKLFKLKGQNLNIKLFMKNNNEDNKEKNISLNDILFPEKGQNDFIDFCLTDLMINQDEESLFSYNKINLSYNKDKKIFPMLKIIQNQKNETKINENEILIDLKCQIIFSFNSKMLENILNYVKDCSQLFPRNEINNDKIKVNIKDDNNINNNNIENDCNANLFFKLKEIKIFLIENEDFDIEKLLSDLPKNAIDNEINDYICINLKEIGAKLENYENNAKGNIYLKSLIIEDNMMDSKYRILFSNYNFKNKEEILINCDLDIKKNKEINKYEIDLSIVISSFAIYLDLITLYYIYNIFKDKKEIEQKENIPVKNKTKIKIIENNNSKYIINNVNIEYFFMEINYNSNNKVKDTEFLNKSIVKRLFSLNNLKIYFNEYKKENSNTTPKETFNQIYQFYYDDIISQMMAGSFAPAVPGLNQLSSVIDGFQDVVTKPIQNYKRNESVTEGFVSGISSLVVKTTTMLTYIGESFINILGCTGRNEIQDKDNICRTYRHKINEKNKEIEEYYFK